MYFRILVNLNGDKFFRTSRLHSAKAMLTALSFLTGGACSAVTEMGQEFDISVLSVDDDGQGHILTADELTTLNDEVLAAAEVASENAQPLG